MATQGARENLKKACGGFSFLLSPSIHEQELQYGQTWPQNVQQTQTSLIKTSQASVEHTLSLFVPHGWGSATILAY